jgi:hypothetical protein
MPIYVDRDVTIKGTYTDDGYTDRYDVSLKKGWNYLNMSYMNNSTGRTYTHTASTSLPSGCTCVVWGRDY